VEVKTLFGSEEFLPEQKIDFFKQRKLIKTAESWLVKNKVALDSKWQIDIIALRISRGEKTEVQHFPNAVF